MAEKYFALPDGNGHRNLFTSDWTGSLTPVYVLTAVEWAKWRALYLAVNQQDRDAMLIAVDAIDGGTYSATIAGEMT